MEFPPEDDGLVQIINQVGPSPVITWLPTSQHQTTPGESAEGLNMARLAASTTSLTLISWANGRKGESNGGCKPGQVVSLSSTGGERQPEGREREEKASVRGLFSLLSPLPDSPHPVSSPAAAHINAAPHSY